MTRHVLTVDLRDDPAAIAAYRAGVDPLAARGSMAAIDRLATMRPVMESAGSLQMEYRLTFDASPINGDGDWGGILGTLVLRSDIVPASLDDQAISDIGLPGVSPPTDAAHRSVPAASLPTVAGSSYKVAQHSPVLVTASSMWPTSAKVSSSSLERRMVPSMRPF